MLHFHAKHSVAGCADPHTDWPDYARALLATFDRIGAMIMSANQDAIDALALQLATLAADLSAAKDAAANAGPVEESLDFSGLQAAAAQLEEFRPAAPAADPAPAAAAPVAATVAVDALPPLPTVPTL